VLFSSALAAGKTPPQAAPGTGTLQVRSHTVGADVIVDGQSVGKVPLEQPLTLPPGEHSIRIVKPGFAPYIDVFTVAKKKPTALEVDLDPVEGVLHVTASVESAHVFVDGKFVGEAPLQTTMAVGPRAIQVSKGGYRDFFRNVSSVAGQEVALDVKLEELPVGLNPYKPVPAAPARWYEKWWVWTAAAGGVAVVVTAIALGVTLGRPSDQCGGSIYCTFVRAQ
jgi:hypothetical protein